MALVGLLVLGGAISTWIDRSPGWAYDFHAYYDAAVRFLATGTPYQPDTLSGPFRPGPYGLYLYSPVLAALFVPLTWLGEQGANLVWLALRLAAVVAICAFMPISRRLRLAVFGVAALSAPVLFDLDLGNVSLLVTLAAVLVWRMLDRPLGG
ncbi:MAG: glycosyltransferase 87 family protein, partial [Chloroflexota bacterium]|nr:glycosyltransferase 87 family protein [Chloroflexota bacterium]